MNLPDAISDLIQAQNEFDSLAYDNCFAETAVVIDEGKTYIGKNEIQQWIGDAHSRYAIRMEPIIYIETDTILKAEVSGTFDGSPVVLSYHFELAHGRIQSLTITG